MYIKLWYNNNFQLLPDTILSDFPFRKYIPLLSFILTVEKTEVQGS